MPVSINDSHHNNAAIMPNLFIIMLNVFMPSVIMLNVVMLSVAAPYLRDVKGFIGLAGALYKRNQSQS